MREGKAARCGGGPLTEAAEAKMRAETEQTVNESDGQARQGRVSEGARRRALFFLKRPSIPLVKPETALLFCS